MEKEHGCLLVVAFLVLVVLGVFIDAAFQYGTADHVTFEVLKTERIVESHSDDKGSHVTSKYLVFTDGETFENTDTMFYWKWNSSDLYGRLEPGRSYRAKVYGWRVPMFSWYRNIVAVGPEEHNGESPNNDISGPP